MRELLQPLRPEQSTSVNGGEYSASSRQEANVRSQENLAAAGTGAYCRVRDVRRIATVHDLPCPTPHKNLHGDQRGGSWLDWAPFNDTKVRRLFAALCEEIPASKARMTPLRHHLRLWPLSYGQSSLEDVFRFALESQTKVRAPIFIALHTLALVVFLTRSSTRSSRTNRSETLFFFTACAVSIGWWVYMRYRKVKKAVVQRDWIHGSYSQSEKAPICGGKRPPHRYFSWDLEAVAEEIPLPPSGEFYFGWSGVRAVEATPVVWVFLILVFSESCARGDPLGEARYCCQIYVYITLLLYGGLLCGRIASLWVPWLLTVAASAYSARSAQPYQLLLPLSILCVLGFRFIIEWHSRSTFLLALPFVFTPEDQAALLTGTTLAAAIPSSSNVPPSTKVEALADLFGDLKNVMSSSNGRRDDAICLVDKLQALVFDTRPPYWDLKKKSEAVCYKPRRGLRQEEPVSHRQERDSHQGERDPRQGKRGPGEGETHIPKEDMAKVFEEVEAFYGGGAAVTPKSRNRRATLTEVPSLLRQRLRRQTMSGSFSAVISAEEVSRLGYDMKLDILRLARNNHIRSPFAVLGPILLREISPILDIEDSTLLAFLLRLDRCYLDLPYHNALHGFAVAHQAMVLLRNLGQMQETRSWGPVENFAFLLACFGHDAGHPGRTSAFIDLARDPLVTLYPAGSPLEHMHAAILLSGLEDPSSNVLKCVTKTDILPLRRRMVETILATDMTLNKWLCTRWRLAFPTLDPVNDSDDAWLLASMVIKLADIGHVILPFEQHLNWSLLCVEEFYAQNEEELAWALTAPQVHPTTPAFDRSRHNETFPRTQLGFMRILAEPVVRALTDTFQENAALQELDVLFVANMNVWEDEEARKEYRFREGCPTPYYALPSDLAPLTTTPFAYTPRRNRCADILLREITELREKGPFINPHPADLRSNSLPPSRPSTSGPSSPVHSNSPTATAACTTKRPALQLKTTLEQLSEHSSGEHGVNSSGGNSSPVTPTSGSR